MTTQFALAVVALALALASPAHAEEGNHLPSSAFITTGASAELQRLRALVGSWGDRNRAVVITDVQADGSLTGIAFGHLTLAPGSRAYVDGRGKVRVKFQFREGSAEGIEYDEYELRDGALVLELWGGLPGHPSIIRLERQAR